MLTKVNSTEDVLAGIAGVIEKTFRRWAWLFIDATAQLSYSLERGTIVCNLLSQTHILFILIILFVMFVDYSVER